MLHRLLDVFFKTLDTVDAARDRLDRVLGREPRADPWEVKWPDEDPAADAEPQSATEEPSSSEKSEEQEKATAKKATAKKATAKKATAKKATAKKATAKKATAKKATAKKTSDVTGRKGSVDRIGKDVASPRAEAVFAFWSAGNSALKALGEETDFLGKKILARSIWALSLANESGEKEGMTTADISSLLSKAAKLEVYPTNIGRACRDHDAYIESTIPDGRSKRFALTSAGKKAAADLFS